MTVCFMYEFINRETSWGCVKGRVVPVMGAVNKSARFGVVIEKEVVWRFIMSKVVRSRRVQEIVERKSQHPGGKGGELREV